MGKLTICVRKCELLHSFQNPSVNPRVVISVDNTYRFETQVLNSTHNPVYEETFSVGNTHHLAKVEVSVYHVMKTKVIDFNSALNTLGIGNAIGLASNVGPSKGLAPNALTEPFETSDGVDGNILLGRCFLSLQRLTKGLPKTRSYVFGTPPRGKNVAWMEEPEGVAGTIVITLQSDSLGELPEILRINEHFENRYTRRLKRLLLRYEAKKIPVIDIILSNVRDPCELGSGVVLNKPKTLLVASASTRYSSKQGSLTTQVSHFDDPALNVSHPDEYESFEELMRRLCRTYKGQEPDELSVSVSISGCSCLDRSVMDKCLSSTSATVYAILRTSLQEFTTEEVTLHSTVSWTKGTYIFDIIDLDSFTLLVVVMGKVGSKLYEIGHIRLGFHSLLRHHASPRNMFLCSFGGSSSCAVAGMAHLLLKPLNFGDTPLERVNEINQHCERVGIFLKHYDPMVLPRLDMLIRGHAGKLGELMKDLIMLYGYEPNTVKLRMTVNTVISLHEGPITELNRKRVVVIVTMGGVSFRTRSREVQRFTETRFDEEHVFHVIRDTDYIRVDVTKDSDEAVVYGSVEFSCLNMPRGAPIVRRLYLVGNSGKSNAYLSGIITITLFSNNMGCTYKVDEDLENTYAGRLRRYAQRYFPQSLHCVNLTTAAIFDMESFMAELSVVHEREDPTYAVYMTIIGCRQLRSRFGGINPYVVVRLDVDTYSTRWIKDSTEPDFFEFTEFYCDQLRGKCITLIVMDHSDMGRDKEIGYAVVSLESVQLGQFYYVSKPLQSLKKYRKEDDSDLDKEHVVDDQFNVNGSYTNSVDTKKMLGSVGFKFSVVNLKNVDRTRIEVTRREYVRLHGDPAISNIDLSHPGTLNHLRSNTRSSFLSDSSAGELVNPHNTSMFPNRLFRYIGSNLRFIGKARNFMMHYSVEFVENIQRNVGFSNDTSPSNSFADAPQLGDTVLAAKCPTFNLMDRFYGLFGHHSKPDSTVSNTMDSDVEALEGQLQRVSQFSNLGGWGSGDSDRMLLHVRVLFCKNLVQTHFQWLNPYVLLFTAGETYRTEMDFETRNPVYAEEFVFHITDPHEDFLQLYVLTETPYGVKRLGHCVFSLCNVQRGRSHTRRAPLVVDSNSPNAFEHGTVGVLMMAENFGLEYLPSADAENRLREQIHGYLSHAAPAQLHWLEWFVGMYAGLSKSVLARLFGKGHVVNKSKQAAAVQVGVRTLSKMSLNGIYVSGNCVVKAKVGSKTYAKTHVAVGVDGHFQVDKTLDIKLENIETTILRIVVIINGKIKCGECWLSLAGLHRGVVQERTHMLVQNVRGSKPFPCGLITISLLSYDFGSYSEPHCKEEEEVYTRLQPYLSYYKPSELINADIIFANVFNPNAYMRKLTDIYGPDPGNYTLRVTIKRCVNLYFSNYGHSTGRDSAQGRSRTSINPFCVLRCGLDEYRTQISEGKGEWIFNENLTVQVGLPELEVIELIVFNFYASRNIEIGRTRVFIDKFKRGVVNTRKLLLVSNAGTKYAMVNGIVELDLFSNDIGTIPQQSNAVISSTSYEHNPSFSLCESSSRAEFPSEAYGPLSDGKVSTSARGLGNHRNSLSLPSLSLEKVRTGAKEMRGRNSLRDPGYGHSSSPYEHTLPFSLNLPDPDANPTTSSPLSGGGGSRRPLLPGEEEADVSDSSSEGSHYEEADIYQVSSFVTPTTDPTASKVVASTEPSFARSGTPTAPPSPSALPSLSVEVTFAGFTFASLPGPAARRELYVRVTDPAGRALFRTEPIPLAGLVRLGRSFAVRGLARAPDLVLTLKVGVCGAFRHTALCRAAFCFNDCRAGATAKALRLYDARGGFVGVAQLHVRAPEGQPLPPSWAAPPGVAAAALGLIADDIASLSARYSPQGLGALDLRLARARDPRRLHATLRRKLAPEVLATAYVVVHGVEVAGGGEAGVAVAVAAVVAGYAAEARQQRPALHGGRHAAFFPYGMARAETQTLLFCPLRVDLPASDARLAMTLRVRACGDGAGPGEGVKGREIGQAVVSLRALLTPGVYDLFERVTVPLVRVTQAANSMQTTPVGSLTFSIAPAAYERYAPPVSFPSAVVRGFSRRYVRYYERRIASFMGHYNVGKLGSLHADLYDTFVANGTWRSGLPEYLSQLVEQWGEEFLPPEPVPSIDSVHTQ